MVDEPVLFEYLEELEELIRVGKDQEGKDLPDKLLSILNNFIVRQTPTKINFDVIIDRRINLITEIEKETKESAGWFKNEPIGNSINNLIDTIKDTDRASRNEITNFKWLLDTINDYLIEVVQDKELLEKQLEAEIARTETMTEDETEPNKAEEDVDIIRKYGETYDDVTIPEIAKIANRTIQRINTAFKKLEKEKVIEKTKEKREKSTIWRFVKD